MSTELKETLCDFGLAFYIIIGLFGYLCFSSKQPSKPKVFKEDEKLNEKKPAKKKSDLIANIIEIGIWLTIVCFSFYSSCHHETSQAKSARRGPPEEGWVS